MSQQLDKLMQTEMTRKQFLKTLGTGLLALLGLSAILRALDYEATNSRNLSGSYGYGSSPYGGAHAPADHQQFG